MTCPEHIYREYGGSGMCSKPAKRTVLVSYGGEEMLRGYCGQHAAMYERRAAQLKKALADSVNRDKARERARVMKLRLSACGIDAQVHAFWPGAGGYKMEFSEEQTEALLDKLESLQ